MLDNDPSKEDRLKSSVIPQSPSGELTSKGHLLIKSQQQAFKQDIEKNLSSLDKQENSKLSCSQEVVSISNLYSKSYGNPQHPPLIFFHGGPGFHSQSFELIVAEELSKKGFFVIVFDQRGCGRSGKADNSQYTFVEANSDTHAIYKKYGIKRATLIGHSFGGTVASKYAEQHPEKVNSLVLVSSPVSYPHTLKTIMETCRERFQENSFESLQMRILEKHPKSLAYSTFAFFQAMKLGLYNPSFLSESAQQFYKDLEKSQIAVTPAPVKGFHEKENYTLLDITEVLKKVGKQNPICALYGAEDGLFDEAQFKKMENIVGSKNFKIFQNASHNVFIDQRREFLDKLTAFLSDVIH